VLVMRHTGLCVKRQCAAFAGIANGSEKCNAFFEKLVRRGYAVATDCIHNRARLYHVHHKTERFMPGGAAHDGGDQHQRQPAASVGITRLGLNRYSGAGLWRLNSVRVG
jgi:hypothetical protein